jgi:pilus assembly protein Flp/PilA
VIGDHEGVTAIEYGLLAALIAVASVFAMGTVGTSLSATFKPVTNSLVKAPAGHLRDPG